jgi:hypothetical protein
MSCLKMRASIFSAFLATCALAASPSPTCAADWYTGAPNDGPPSPKAPRAAIDIALDGTSQAAFSAAVIGTIAPFTPLDRTGFRLRGSGIVGSYVYDSAIVGTVHGNLIGGAFLMGYEWVSKRATVGVYAGGEGVNNAISPNDPNNQAKGTSVGLKLLTDFYVRPTDETMISGVFSYSTNFNSYYGRLKFGMAFSDRIYVGPEIGTLGDNFFQQWRIGGHVTGVQLGMLQFGAALGFLNDRVRGSGLYGTVDSRVTF